MNWQIHYRIYRQKSAGDKAHYDDFTIEMEPDESVLDGVEKIWAQQDRSLTFRHACHHASCGTCGMRVNGVEKLTCVTLIQDVARDGDTLVIEPMRHFPVVSDLVVDMAPFFEKMKRAEFSIIRHAEPTLANLRPVPADEEHFNRFEDCIECGLCVSACPIAGTDDAFLGPAALAGIWRMVEEPRGHDPKALLRLADDAHGAWRCHTALECTAVCPSNVDPGRQIMQMRRRLIVERLKSLFGLSR
ncbi:MAG: succinate dehydrogenase/fumarate reductase iron-sulfur subunit [Chloroflexi bacterium]|nr:MAG: succinate dehydrogenase/fumarate reductase iron-sulfur subunit [Chloroflexota bacterium]